MLPPNPTTWSNPRLSIPGLGFDKKVSLAKRCNGRYRFAARFGISDVYAYNPIFARQGWLFRIGLLTRQTLADGLDAVGDIQGDVGDQL